MHNPRHQISKAACLQPISHRLMQVLFPHLAYITLFPLVLVC